ncbi:hypothetical protein [Ruegeria lacuscaerulensis]|uniref:hypothetical protein n=1 Tax=Ruegeria lacuscaerulensis TaxID=55218 RepID=UPI00147E920D|nr:hypothetical protein [Ruegeria lacuscaerulensis]
MLFLRRTVAAVLIGTLPFAAMAQSDQAQTGGLQIELNTMQDTGEACRLTFVVQNDTGTAIETASFQTVIFDAEGTVERLTLFSFRDMPKDRVRVRQFDLTGITCAGVGQVLFNGTSSCLVDGADSPICDAALTLSSRTDTEVLG